MDRHSEASSDIRSIGYDPKTQTLEVEFRNGWVYQYYGVPRKLQDDLMQAQSKGQFLQQKIKNAYPYSRVG